MRKKHRYIFRDSKTGEIASKAYGKKHPSTTEREEVPIIKRKKK